MFGSAFFICHSDHRTGKLQLEKYINNWKNYSDQTYSCPQDWRLSASEG